MGQSEFKHARTVAAGAFLVATQGQPGDPSPHSKPPFRLSGGGYRSWAHPRYNTDGLSISTHSSRRFSSAQQEQPPECLLTAPNRAVVVYLRHLHSGLSRYLMYAYGPLIAHCAPLLRRGAGLYRAPSPNSHGPTQYRRFRLCWDEFPRAWHTTTGPFRAYCGS